MYRLTKQGIVRETESRLEADTLRRLGYALEEGCAPTRPGDNPDISKEPKKDGSRAEGGRRR